MSFPIDSPLPIFYDRNGDVLDAGYIYIGAVNQNPELVPAAVYWDAAQTQPAPQPLRTVRGFIARSGSPAIIYVPSDYSIVVRDRNRQLLLNEPSQSTLATSGGSDQIGFIQAGTGAVARTVQSKLRDAINVKDFGATGDGATNDQTALQNALTYASSVGRDVYIPAGQYRHSGVLTISGITVSGDGVATKLIATDSTPSNPQHAILLTGSSPKLQNVEIYSTWIGGRQTNTNAHGVTWINATDFEISGCVVHNTAAAGILGQFGRNFSIHNNRVYSTLADGIHATNDSTGFSIYANSVSSTGDDAIAVVSYNLPRPAEYGGGNWPQSGVGEIWGNRISGGSARGVSVIGSRDVLVFGNFAEDTAAAGFAVSSETAFTSYNPFNVHFFGNIADGCATSGVLNHAQFYAYTQGSGYTMDRIRFSNNSAIGSPSRNAFRAQNLSGGGPIDGLNVTGMDIDGTGKISLLSGTFDNVVIRNTTARNLADGVYTISAISGDASIIGGDYWDVFQTPSLNRFVDIATAAGITSLTINDHNVIGTENMGGVIYAGDSSVTAARPFIMAMRNTANRRLLADVTGVVLNGSNYSIPLSFTTNDINQTLSYAGTQAFEVLFSGTRHQALEVNFKIVRSNDSTQWQMLRQRWIYTNSAGVGTAGVDYVDTGGGFRIQRTDIENFSSGTVGAWTMTLASGNVTATFTPSVASHIRFNVTGVYRSA